MTVTPGGRSIWTTSWQLKLQDKERVKGLIGYFTGGGNGALCSADKHVYQAEVATELGVEVNGPSATRIFKAVLASLH